MSKPDESNLALLTRPKVLCTYCVPLISSMQYTNDVNVFRASWKRYNISGIVAEKYDLTFLVVFKTDDPAKKLLSSQECFASLGIKNFGIDHIHTFHPNVGKDIGSYVQVARDYKFSDYEVFMFMSTSTDILHSMCLTYVIDALNDKNIGMSGVHGIHSKGYTSYEFNPAIRTNLFCVRKDTLPLIGAYEVELNDMQRYNFETGNYNITAKVLNYGLRAVVVTPQNELLDWDKWNRNEGFLRGTSEYILASDRASLLNINWAKTNMNKLYNTFYPSSNTIHKREFFKQNTNI